MRKRHAKIAIIDTFWLDLKINNGERFSFFQVTEFQSGSKITNQVKNKLVAMASLPSLNDHISPHFQTIRLEFQTQA